MTRLSDNPLVPSLRGPGGDKFVPFTAFVRLTADPGFGRRFETIRDLEKKADAIEDALSGLIDVGTSEISFDFAFPVKFTFQFGDHTARATIHGNMKLDAGSVIGNTNFTKTPFGERIVINSGEFKTGFSSHNAVSRDPSSILDGAVTEIRGILEALTDVEVIRLEVAHRIYGKDSRSTSSRGAGFHFPR